MPDVQTYKMLLDASDDLEFSESLWRWMWKESQQDVLLRPDIVTLRTLMKAWVTSGRAQAVERCEGLVDEWMDHHNKSSTIHNSDSDHHGTKGIRKSLIYAWALQDPAQAEAYLKDMAERHLENKLEEAPDTITWNRVILAYAIAHGQPEQAARLLKDFWDYSQINNNNNDYIHPDLFSYNSVLEGLARIGNADQAKKTFTRLQMAKSTSPNIISYTSAIKRLR
jgi:pentatricopeptide repeat protein